MWFNLDVDGIKPLLCALVICALCWAGWRTFRGYVVKTELDNIPGPPSHSFWFGNYNKVFSTQGWDFHRTITKKYGSVIRMNMFLGEKQLYIYDPKALHNIIVKDQNIYEETEGFLTGNDLFFGPGLLATLGDQHRKQRKMLNPVFSMAHMRQMIPTFYEVIAKLEQALTQKIQQGEKEIEVVHWMTRTALELIGQSGLGYSFDTLVDGAAPHIYAVSVKELVPTSFKLFPLRSYVLPWAVKLGTPELRRSIVNLLPWDTLHKLRDMIDIMHETSVEIIEGKKKALREGDEAVARQIGHGKDIISILLRANMEASEEDRLSDSEVLGQMSSLIFAAMDTTSTAISRVLYILACHQEAQEKLRKELRECKAEIGGQLSYNELDSLPYLDAVCRETLRLYPPVSTLSRTTRKDVILPFSNPIRGVDGREMTEVLVPKDTNVIISIIGANRNPAMWGPDAEEWKPERWMSALPEEVAKAHMPGVYSHLMTFLGGSRACIGFKFAQLELKAVLSVIVDKFNVELSDKEIQWAMASITAPYVVGDNSGKPKLPLKFSFA